MLVARDELVSGRVRAARLEEVARVCLSPRSVVGTLSRCTG
jgi:hypothetical protein